MAALPTVQPDITLLLDMDGVIREATLSPAMSAESVDGWLGRPWVEIAGDMGGDKVKRMVDDARASGISAFRQINQRFPSGLEIPMEFTTVLLGGDQAGLQFGDRLKVFSDRQHPGPAAKQHGGEFHRDFGAAREALVDLAERADAADAGVIDHPPDLVAALPGHLDPGLAQPGIDTLAGH